MTSSKNFSYDSDKLWSGLLPRHTLVCEKQEHSIFPKGCLRVVEAIIILHYVNDYLDSFDTIYVAKTMEGGFIFLGLVSNNSEVQIIIKNR